jgi:hypothetical protein
MLLFARHLVVLAFDVVEIEFRNDARGRVPVCGSGGKRGSPTATFD